MPYYTGDLKRDPNLENYPELGEARLDSEHHLLHGRCWMQGIGVVDDKSN